MAAKVFLEILFLVNLASGIKEPFRWMSNACRIQTDNGIIDLTPLANTNLQPRFRDQEDPTHAYTYSFNPCLGFDEGSCKNVSICQTFKSVGSTVDLGYPTQVAYQDIPGRAGALIYNAVDELGQNRISTISLTCESNVEGEFIVEEENPVRNYHFELITKYACLNSPTPPPPVTGGSATVTSSPPRPHPGIFSLKTITILLFSILCSLVIVIILLIISVVAKLVRRNTSNNTQEKSSFAYKQMS